MDIVDITVSSDSTLNKKQRAGPIVGNFIGQSICSSILQIGIIGRIVGRAIQNRIGDLRSGDRIGQMGWRESVVPVACVKLKTTIDLPKVVDTVGFSAAFSRSDEHWEKQSCQQSDDGDDNQYLDQ